MKRLLIALTFLFATWISEDSVRAVIIWNVGQGQWITIKHELECLNIDSGGEKFPTLYSNLCSHNNYSVFTHADNDHINFFKKSAARMLTLPRILKSKTAKKLFRNAAVETTQPGIRIHRYTVNDSHEKTATNGFATAYLSNGILVPGDLSATGENILREKILPYEWLKIKWVMASHHGSRNGQSAQWLKFLESKQVIVSARQRRYGHPHTEAILRWKKNKIPVLQTEDWGHIIFFSFR